MSIITQKEYNEAKKAYLDEYERNSRITEDYFKKLAKKDGVAIYSFMVATNPFYYDEDERLNFLRQYLPDNSVDKTVVVLDIASPKEVSKRHKDEFWTSDRSIECVLIDPTNLVITVDFDSIDTTVEEVKFVYTLFEHKEEIKKFLNSLDLSKQETYYDRVKSFIPNLKAGDIFKLYDCDNYQVMAEITKVAPKNIYFKQFSVGSKECQKNYRPELKHYDHATFAKQMFKSFENGIKLKNKGQL